eukprot:jgi/Psemu1/301429/fgenesh1_kg.34_\
MKSTASFLLVLLPGVIEGFCGNSVSTRSNSRQSTTTIFDGNGTGGWGIGGQREITPEEYARGDRRYFDGYKMNEQGDFMKQIEEEKEALQNDAMTELLGVAKFAGLKMKDPSSRLNKFDDGFMDDDDDLDLSV